MDKLLIDYGNQNKILNKALDVRQNWEEIQEKLNAAISELEGYGSIAPDTVVLISEMSDEIRNIENNKDMLQGFIASFSRYLDRAREVEEDLQLYINDSQGYTVVISSQIAEKERLATCKFVIGALIIVGSIALAIVCPATSPILAKILTGMAIGSATGGIIGGGLTAAFGGDYCDVADGFFAGTVTGAFEGGLSVGTGYTGFARYILKDLAIGTTADFGYGMVEAAIEGNPNGVIMGGFDQAFNPINIVTNLGTGMFGAGIGSGKIKLKMPEGLKVPEWVSSPFRKGAPSVTDVDKQIKNSSKIKDFIDRFTFNSNKFSSQLKREAPEVYEELKSITKDINNKKYVTMSMNGGGQLRNIALEKVNKFVKDIPELETVIKSCTDEDKLKKIVKMCDTGDVVGLRRVIEEVSNSKYTIGNEVSPKYSTLQQRYEIMPADTSSVGKWTGKPGESIFISDDIRVKKILEEYGVKGVSYKNGMPDFSLFVKEEFTIDMTKDRQKNFAKANKQLAEKFSKETGEKWTAKKASDWVSENNLTWHELNDCKTIQLIPSPINHPIFKHLGGVGEIKIGIRNGVE